MEEESNGYLEFCSGLMGYKFFNKKTGSEVFRWELFFTGYKDTEVFSKFNKKARR